MSLYDDIDTSTDKTDSSNVAGWASGMKFMQTHVQLKKKALPQPKREVRPQQLAPVVAFKGKSGNIGHDNSSGSTGTSFILPYSISVSKKPRGGHHSGSRSFTFIAVDPEWQFDNEYDPYFPNEYEKALKDLRERRDREAEEAEIKRRTENPNGDGDELEIEMEEGGIGSSNIGGSSIGDKAGVTIAPPASLHIDYDDDQPFQPPSSFSNSGEISKPSFLGVSSGGRGGLGMGLGGAGATAAAKIMAKYGYKEGTGLGRLSQGMSTALQVEKTSHRIGRIIHEKDVQKEGVVSLVGIPSNLAASYMDDDEFEMEPPQQQQQQQSSQEPYEVSLLSKSEQEQYAEEQLKSPSKVVLLSNMVGPGDVDDDLEPEVKEECQKYGEVVTVIVFKMPDVDSEDSIRIFVEFFQVTSAVKAFMDLNGRFFGGRQVRAAFYDPEKFNNLELTC